MSAPSPRPAPGFDRFIAELRDEIAWLETIHANDGTGQGATDRLALARLAKHVKAVQDSLGY